MSFCFFKYGNRAKKKTEILYFIPSSPQFVPVFIALLMILLTISQSSASSIKIQSLEWMCEKSEEIFQGVVIDKKSAYETSGQIWTTYRIQIQKPLKSKSNNTKNWIEIKQIGGTVGNLTLEASGIPHFAVGEEVFLFTKDFGAQWQSILNGPQGCFRISTQENSEDSHKKSKNKTSPAIQHFYPGLNASISVFIDLVQETLTQLKDQK